MPEWLYWVLWNVGWKEGFDAYQNGISSNPYHPSYYAEYSGWQSGWWHGWDVEN
jgi:hypothetical protein